MVKSVKTNSRHFHDLIEFKHRQSFILPLLVEFFVVTLQSVVFNNLQDCVVDTSVELR